jgi:hypothetical protein
MKSLFLASMMIISTTAFAELYDGGSHPLNFSRIAGIIPILTFDSLPLTGKLADDRLGWSETYWPSNRGGIAYRWNHPNPQPFKYRLNSKEELMKMSEEELSQLSPAELYDISNNDYSYSLTKRVFSLFTSNDMWWEGICHGWAQAAINYPEPRPVAITNQAGIKVSLGSSDVKGLLAMHEAYNYKGQTFAFSGRRCKVNGKVVGEEDQRDPVANRAYPTTELAESPDCKDVNAGAFHVIISNMLGLLGKGFVADIDRFNDVWNQPVAGYTTTIVGEEPVLTSHAAVGITKRVRIKLKMKYGEELQFYTPELAAQGKKNFVSKFPVTMTENQEFRYRNYEYIIEVNSAGNIIGGEWISSTRPDFIWIYGRSTDFKNGPVNLTHLKHIYRPVRR